MFSYRAYGLNISSEFPISPLINVNKDHDVFIRKKKISFPKDEAYFNFLLENNCIILFWKDISTFMIRNGSEILVDPASNVDKQVLCEYIRGLPMGILLSQREYLVLHASAVNINGQAVAFLGQSGSGKSTTAAAFYKKGYRIITDDILAVDINGSDVPEVHHGFPYIKLSDTVDKFWGGGTDGPQSVEEDQKHRIIKDFPLNPMPLAKIYVLKRGQSLRLDKLDVQEALIELLRHSYNNSFFEESNKTQNLLQCAKLLKEVQVKCLKVKHSFDEIPELIRLIEDESFVKDNG